MKVFKDWKENDISSFVMYLAKECLRQRRKMAEYYKKYAENIDPQNDNSYIYLIQKGCVLQADMNYVMAKATFKFDKRKNA
jgi:hypothetical protein